MLYKFIEFPNLDETRQEIIKNLPTIITKISGFRAFNSNKFNNYIFLKQGIEHFTSWSNVIRIAIITLAPEIKKEMHIHIDYDKEYKNFFAYSLNIPVLNCDAEGSYSVWYKELKTIDDPELEEVGRMTLSKAAFFNTQIPHHGINLTNETRCVLSVRFKEPFDF